MEHLKYGMEPFEGNICEEFLVVLPLTSGANTTLGTQSQIGAQSVDISDNDVASCCDLDKIIVTFGAVAAR